MYNFLASLIAAQQTNFGRVRTSLSSLSQVRLKNFGYISPHLSRFQEIEIEALSILRNLGIDVEEKKSCFV